MRIPAIQRIFLVVSTALLMVTPIGAAVTPPLFLENAGQLDNERIHYSWNGGRMQLGFADGRVHTTLLADDRGIALQLEFVGARAVRPIAGTEAISRRV